MEEIDNVFSNQALMADGIYSFLRNSFPRSSNSSRNEPNSASLNSSNIIYNDASPIERYSFNALHPALASTLTEPDTFHLRRRRATARLNHENNDFIEMIAQGAQGSESNEASLLTDSSDLKASLAAGGFSEEMFLYLSDKEKDEFACSICYAILKETYQCKNEHRFCYGCIYTWATGRGVGHDCCPMCRCDGLYAKNEEIDERISAKRVRCLRQNCNWLGFLHEYFEHKHRYYEPTEMSIFSKATLEKLQRRKLAQLSRLANGAVYNEFTLPNGEAVLPQTVRQRSSFETISPCVQELHATILPPLQLSPYSSASVDIGIQHSSYQPNNPEDRGIANLDHSEAYADDDFVPQRMYSNNFETTRSPSNLNLLQDFGQNGGSSSLNQARILLRSLNSQSPVDSNDISRYSSSNGRDQFTLNQNACISNLTGLRRRVGSGNLTPTEVRPSAQSLDTLLWQNYDSNDAELNMGINLRQDNGGLNSSPREYNNARPENFLHDIFANNDHSSSITQTSYRSEMNVPSNHAVSPRPRFNILNRLENVNEYARNHSGIAETSNTRERSELVYRRLVPVRPNQILEQLRETREQLTAMLNLMTAQLEGRRQNTLLDESGSGPIVYDETNLARVRSRLRSGQALPNSNLNRETSNSVYSPASGFTTSSQETPLRFANTRNFALQHLARLHRIELLLNEINNIPPETSDSSRPSSQLLNSAPNFPILQAANTGEIVRNRRGPNSVNNRVANHSDLSRFNLQTTSTETSSSNENDNLTEAIRHVMSLWSSDDELS